MNSTTSSDVAIIGAGLSGLVLAVAIRQQNPSLRVSIFVSRADPHENPYSGGAIMLSPNSLRIFDKLDAYTALEAHGAEFEEMEFLTHELKVTDTY